MSQPASSLQRRVRPPTASQGVLDRPRLTGLSAMLARYRLALVHAPAGSGKTTLIAQWHEALRAAGVATAWYSANEDDRDPLAFADGLLRAVELDARRSDGAVPPQNLPDALSRLVAALSEGAASEPLVLFVDDYHLAERGDGGGTVGRILSARIPQLTLVLASRSRPSVPVGRLRVSGEVIEVAVEDLSFDEAETEAFFRLAAAVPLTANESRQMRDYTEGWAAGLRLASLVAGRSAEAVMSAVPTGSHRAFADYFLEEVLLGLPRAVDDFLCRTSILDALNADLCNAVTGGEDGAEMLAFLEGAQLFVVALPGNQRWYKYHHLFQEFLAARLNADGRAAVADLHARAAQWFIDHGSPVDAVRHAFLARRPDWAAELIEEYCVYDYLSHGRFETFSRWMQQLPREAREERPLLLLLQVWRSINLRRFLQAEQTLSTIKTAAADSGSRLSTIARDSGLDIAGRLHLMRALIGAYGGDLAMGFTHIERLEGWDLDLLAFGQVDLDSIHSYLCLQKGDLELAERLTWRANGVYDGMACHWGRVHSLCIAAMSYMVRGWYGEAGKVLADALAVAETNFGQHSYMVALPSALIGQIAYNHGAFAEAEKLWRRAIPTDQATDVSGLCERLLVATVGLARLLDREGRFEEATALLVRVRRLAYEGEDFRLEFHLAIEQADRAFRLGNPAEGNREWERLSLHLAEARRRFPGSVWQVWDPFLIVEARVLAETGEIDKAVERLRAIADVARSQQRVTVALQVDRLIRQMEGRSGTAGERHPELDAVLDDYLSARRPAADVASRSGSLGGNTGTLTQRELEVLELMHWGLSNGEIAARLGINLNTVKSHSKSIFSKLGVRNRTQAVLRTLPDS